MKTHFYLKGEPYAYTGETRMIYGGLFYVGRDMAGREAVTMRGPDGSDPLAEQAKVEYKMMQDCFRRLSNNNEN